MTINHHLNDATLMAYAAGSVPENMALVIATHLSMCAECRAKLDVMEDLGAEELNQIPMNEMSVNAMDSIMAQLDDDFVVDKKIPRNDVSDEGKAIPVPLRDFLPNGLSGIDWKTMAPGIKSYTLPDVKSGKGSARLLQISPGVTIPEHSHSGSELTLILSGAYSDEIGRFKIGDIADIDEETSHQPIADTNEACICLIATEAPLKFKSLMPKMMQYFIGM